MTSPTDIKALMRDLAATQAALKGKVELLASVNRKLTLATHRFESMGADIQATGVDAVLAGRPVEPNPDMRRALLAEQRKRDAAAGAIPVLQAEIAALQAQVAKQESTLTSANFAYSCAAQAAPVEALKAGIAALAPHLAALIAVDRFREAHCQGAMSGVPVGADRPWQSTAVVALFLKALPVQLRPASLTLESIQRLALTLVAEIEAPLSPTDKE